jgi:predicted metalloprotease with PDZ domain
VRCAYLTNQRAFFNGSSVFLQPVGFENNTCEVQINYPTDEVLGDWACATSLTLKNKQKDATCPNGLGLSSVKHTWNTCAFVSLGVI